MKNFITCFLFVLINNLYANKHIEQDSTVVNNKNITYTVNKDSRNIFISVETDEKEIAQTLLREGVTIYFDNKGKKKKKVFVQFPKDIQRPPNKKQNERGGRPQPSNKTADHEQPNKHDILENMPQEAIYAHLDTKREFHTLMNDLGIDISFDFLPHHRIKYNLKILKNRINL